MLIGRRHSPQPGRDGIIPQGLSDVWPQSVGVRFIHYYPLYGPYRQSSAVGDV